MTHRERIRKIFKREKPDKVPWFGDLDYWATALITNNKKPPNFKQSTEYIDWHRDLDVGFYLQGYFPFKEINHFEVKEWNEGNRRFRKKLTPKGDLQECWEYIPSSYTEGPVEHFIKSEADLAALRYVYENTEFIPDYSFGLQRLEQIGDQGVLLCYTPKSPFMHLVALEAGIMAVTFAEMAAPDEFAKTLTVIENAFNSAARFAVDSPAEVLMIPENLSSEMVGPHYFAKYMRPYQEKWIKEIRKAGKYSFIHIDGTLKGLLKQEASTGFDVLEALTPKPVGDLAIEEWAGFVDNPDSILWGGIPGVYFTPAVSEDEFDRHVREVLAVMKTEPRYVLGVADQVPPDGLESRVRRVSELVNKYGEYQ
jgi:uroporphyrinogen-III decarboxylase